MTDERWAKLKTVTWFLEEQREVMAYVEKLRDQNSRLIAKAPLPVWLDEALNSGNGVYRP